MPAMSHVHTSRSLAFPVSLLLAVGGLAGCGDDDGGAGGSDGTGATGTGAAGGSGATGGGAAGGGGGGTVDPVVVVVQNAGNDSGLEGHTPRGFMGMGTGLFAGDNLNPNFPDGDGVHFFLTFDLSGVPAGQVQTATLSSDKSSVSGSPYQDLGALNAEEMRFDSFSSALWDQEPVAGGGTCVFATSADGPFECDIASIVQASLDEGYPYAQVRMSLDQAGDSDGSADLAMFFITDSNTNEPGIFELEVAVVPTTP